MPTPIATSLSTYGEGLANFLNISSNIPLMCAINPDGTALGGPGTVGDEDFIANFSAAGGGGDLSKAFDLSGPIPLVCMVNPDGTAYSGGTPVAYTEYKANYVTGVDGDRFITATELLNTLGGAVTAQISTNGRGWFEFVLPTGTVISASKVRVVNTVQSDDIASDRFPFGYYIDGNKIIFFISGIDGNGSNSNGNAAAGSYCSILIEVYP